jgi:hypothetical protein
MVRNECRLWSRRGQLEDILVDHRSRFSELVLRYRICREHPLSTRITENGRWNG